MDQLTDGWTDGQNNDEKTTGTGTPGSSRERHFVCVPIHPVSPDPPRLPTIILNTNCDYVLSINNQPLLETKQLIFGEEVFAQSANHFDTDSGIKRKKKLSLITIKVNLDIDVYPCLSCAPGLVHNVLSYRQVTF